MKYNFDNLIFEITRKCNMKCAHCLRGNAQNKNMNKEVMLEALRNVSYINSVTFGGGEPTLNLDMILYFIECCKILDIEVGNFYIVTNGKAYHKELEDACDALYNFCVDNEISGLTVSDDEFHREWQPNRSLFIKTRDRYLYGEEIYNSEIEKYGEIEEIAKPYARFTDKTHKDGQFHGIINMGRASENGIWDRELNVYFPKAELDNCNDTLFIDGDVYVTYSGDYIATCDSSYERMNEFKFGTIYDKEEAFLKFAKESVA